MKSASCVQAMNCGVSQVMKLSRRVTFPQSIITLSSNILYQLKNNMHRQHAISYSTQVPKVIEYEFKYSKADNSGLTIRTEHTFLLHRSSGMAPVSFSTLALDIQLLICDYLSTDCLTSVAITCKAHRKLIDRFKHSYNAQVSTYAVELSFFDSRPISGWMCLSKTRLMHLKGWVTEGLLVSRHDEHWRLGPDASWSGTALLRQ